MPYNLSELAALSEGRINRTVTRTAPGVYVLDKTTGGLFQVSHVGRSDDDVKARLKQHVRSTYKYFKFDYATSPKNAFEKECELYHDFGGPEGKLDNNVHPGRPKDTDWKCPKCNTF